MHPTLSPPPSTPPPSLSPLPVVDNAITSSALSYDSDGIYFVLSDPSVDVNGFCTQFCGYHDYMRVTGGKNVKYSFVGDTSKCPKSCAMQT